MENKRQWKRRISAYDFAILEVELYLDTHPRDERALQLREVYRDKRRELVEQYEKQFGRYIVTCDDVCDEASSWVWVHDPWPWEFTKEA